MIVRRAAAVLGVLGLVVPLAACGSTPEVEGSAYPDWDAVDEEMLHRLDAELDRLFEGLVAVDPWRSYAWLDEDAGPSGVSYIHMRAGDKTLGWQSRVALVGNPPAVVHRRSSAYEGLMIDYVHYPGESVDYFVLGDAFLDLAPTRWVAREYSPYAPENELAMGLGGLCLVEGLGDACHINDAIYYTEHSDAADRVRRDVTVAEDGSVQVRTEVTLDALIEAVVISVADELLAEWTDEALQTLVPTSFWLDPDGGLLKIEVNGIVPLVDGRDDLYIQAGFESTGLASSADVPPLPPRDEITYVSADEWDAIQVEIDERIMERRRADRGRPE